MISGLLAGDGKTTAEEMRAHVEDVDHDLIDILQRVMPFVQGHI